MNPLNSVKGAMTTGFVLAVIVSVVLTATSGTGHSIDFSAPHLGRWLHILAGVMWIGLLWYFNVVQTPGLAVAAADKGGPGGAGISKYIAPRRRSAPPTGRRCRGGPSPRSPRSCGNTRSTSHAGRCCRR